MRGWSLYCCRTFFALSQSKLPTIIFKQVVVDEVNELRTERLEQLFGSIPSGTAPSLEVARLLKSLSQYH